jgi:trimethylamine--corrinoid protein Co-methyltransferase
MIEFKVLSEIEIEAIHSASLRILAETGIVLTHPIARDMLTGAGAEVKEERVLLPASLVEDQVAKSGRKVSIRGRGGVSKTLGDRPLHWHNLGGARDIYNAGNGTRRKATLQDLQDCTRL